VFANGWVFVGYAHELARSGDALPIEVGGLPLFLIRNQQNEIVAFHNVCRHRNLKLIDKADNCGKLIRCPYHSWSYDLCGALKNAPYFGGEARQIPADFKFEDNGLTSVHCEVWHDWIFVNLSTQPADFNRYLDPIQKLLGHIDVTDYVPVATLELSSDIFLPYPEVKNLSNLKSLIVLILSISSVKVAEKLNIIPFLAIKENNF